MFDVSDSCQAARLRTLKNCLTIICNRNMYIHDHVARNCSQMRRSYNVLTYEHVYMCTQTCISVCVCVCLCVCMVCVQVCVCKCVSIWIHTWSRAHNGIAVAVFSTNWMFCIVLIMLTQHGWLMKNCHSCRFHLQLENSCVIHWWAIHNY